MNEYIEGEDDDEAEDSVTSTDNETGLVTVKAGGHKKHSHSSHHNVRNTGVLPGVFFMYEIYPFAIEISRNSVPLTHLLIRIMAMVGGVFTIVRWIDSCFHERERTRRK
jgi:hypothetical protein